MGRNGITTSITVVGFPDRGHAIKIAEYNGGPLFHLRLTKPVAAGEQLMPSNSEVICINAHHCPADCKVTYPPWEDVYNSVSRNDDMMEAIRFATDKNERTPGRQPWMTDKTWEQHQKLIKKIATPEVQAIIADVKKHSSTIITSLATSFVPM